MAEPKDSGEESVFDTESGLSAVDDVAIRAVVSPGPWSYRPRVMDDWGWVRDADGNTVGHAHAPLSDDDANQHRRDKTDPWEANARMFAASYELYEAARLLEEAEDAHANCPECDGEIMPELCPTCFPLFDDARLKRRAALAKAVPGTDVRTSGTADDDR